MNIFDLCSIHCANVLRLFILGINEASHILYRNAFTVCETLSKQYCLLCLVCVRWMLQVYDVTDFLDEHPGGGDSIVISAGQDSSEEFNVLHSDKARRMLEDYYIGELDTEVKQKETKASSVRRQLVGKTRVRSCCFSHHVATIVEHQ